MGFFNKITKALTIDDENKSNGILGKAKKIVSNVFKPDEKFEWGVKKVKEYSQKKIELSSEISNLEHEFNFYDENVQLKKILEKSQVVESKINEIYKLNSDIKNDKIKVSQLNNDIKKQKDEVIRLINLSLPFDEKYKLDAAEKELNEFESKLSITEKLILINLEKNDQLEIDRLKVMDEYVLELSYIDSNLELIQSIKEENELNSPFATYGVEALKNLSDNYMNAIENVIKLFEIEKSFNNPKLANLYGEYNYNMRLYDEALEAFTYYVSLYPESPDIHNKLYYTHKALGQYEEATLEQIIYEMLN